MVGDPPQAVLIHDGARPLPGSGLIGRVADALRSAPGAVPALPLFDTLKQVDGAGQVERDGAACRLASCADAPGILV